MIRFGFAVLALLLASCAQKPTKVFTSEDIDVMFLEKNVSRPIPINSETVILDARAPFEYAMIHHPTATNIQWQDFSEPEAKSPGILKKDLQGDVRRLATFGVDPGSQVVVVGKGLEGGGAEGRIAWTLLYLGVKDVQTGQTDRIGLRYSNLSPPPRESKPGWTPDIHDKILFTKEDFLAMRDDPMFVKVIDVRTPLEFANKKVSLQGAYPELHPVNMEWSQFFTVSGRPNPSVRKALESKRIGLHDRIVLISNQGVRSGAVTYALLSLGYKNAANFAGGFVELLDLKR